MQDLCTAERKGHISLFSNGVSGSYNRRCSSIQAKIWLEKPSIWISIIWWIVAIWLHRSKLHLVPGVCVKIIWKWFVQSVWLIDMLTQVLQRLPWTPWHSSIKILPNIYLLDFDLNKKFQLFVLKNYFISELKGTTCKTFCENISK